MNDIYVLDKNLEYVGIVDTYKSCIWSNRYNELGDCELYVEATDGMLDLLQKDYYLIRSNDEMVCQIKKIELDTDTENGDFLIVKGKDVKAFLDQRIIWNTMTCDGNLESFILNIVAKTLISPSLSGRKLLKENGSQLLYLASPSGFSEVNTEQVSYKNVGEKVREYCKSNEWGYKVFMQNNVLNFKLYKGTDRTQTVVFSDEYENLSTTKYIVDYTNLGNVALVGGEGEGSQRSRNVSGYAEGTDRYEIFVDAKDISKNITWEQLTDMYPTTDDGGQGYIDHNGVNYVYKMNYLNVEIVDPDQLRQLKINYPSGQEITIDGNQYYQVYNVIIANLPNNTPASNDTVELWAIIYEVYLLNRGYEKLAEYGATTLFEGTVQPDVTFIYKQDYFLGDLVTVKNEYGITATARIVEVIEVNDDKGYSIQPKFEYMEVS